MSGPRDLLGRIANARAQMMMRAGVVLSRGTEPELIIGAQNLVELRSDMGSDDLPDEVLGMKVTLLPHVEGFIVCWPGAVSY